MTKSEHKQASLTGSLEIEKPDPHHEEGKDYEKNNRHLGDWLDKGYTNQKTKDGYYSTMVRFLDIIYPDEDLKTTEKFYYLHMTENQREEIKTKRRNKIEYFLDKYIAENRVFIDDFRLCIHQMVDEEYAPMTINGYMMSIRKFFDRLNPEKYSISERDMDDIKRSLMPPNVTTIQDEIPTKEELKEIIIHLGLMYRALILFLLSTGTRLGAALKLKTINLNLDVDPPWVNIVGKDTKGKVGGRKVWFTSETKDAISAWLKILPKRNKKGRWGSFNENMIFDVKKPAVSRAYNLALKKSGLDQRDPNTKMRVRKYHIHTLRKFFSTEMGESGMPEATIDALMGHSGYLAKAYKRPRELAQKYVKYMHSVTIFEKDLETEMREKLTKGEAEIQDLQTERQETKMTLSIIAMNLDISNPHDLASDSLLIQINNAIDKMKKTLVSNAEEISYLKEIHGR